MGRILRGAVAKFRGAMLVRTDATDEAKRRTLRTTAFIRAMNCARFVQLSR